MSGNRRGETRPLARWESAARRVRQVVCIGDSITHGSAGRRGARATVRRSWIEQLADALDRTTGPRAGDGFRGLWDTGEWTFVGEWTRVAPTDPFDVAPFGQGFYSSPLAVATLAWSKPATVAVGAFDLYWFDMPGAGQWQYRVDGGPWIDAGPSTTTPDNRLHKLSVPAAVSSGVEIRGSDGTRPACAPIVGIGLHAGPTAASRGTIVHNLGQNLAFLEQFCRPSSGDPLALLDLIRPDLVTILFSNDVTSDDASAFGAQLVGLVERVEVYADVLLIAPFEQRPPRSVNDAVTRAGSTTVTSPTAEFGSSDIGAGTRGSGLPKGTMIVAVQSPWEATMSAAATESRHSGELTIGFRRDAQTQAEYRAVTRAVGESKGCAVLDLYDAWSARAGAGWDAANAYGLMHDRLHPTQLGHDDISARVQRLLGTEGR